MKSQKALRNNIRALLFVFCVCAVLAVFSNIAKAADWPQWRGPNRDGICTETGLLKSWPEEGPKLLWELTGLGKGYSSLTIVDGRLYTMGDVRLGSENVQCVLAYDLSTHKRLWAAKVGPTHDDGPRCTPTVDENFIYAIGTSGDVVCIEADTGKVRWSKNLQADLGGKNPNWKYSESPLVDGDKLLCTPGGRNAVIAALNKKTGELIWKSSMPDIGPKGKEEAGYSSIVVTETGDIQQYVQLTNKGLIGIDAKDGRFLWGYNKIANRVANIPTPVVYGDYIFCSTSYSTGSVLLKLAAEGNNVDAKEIYFLDDRTFQNHHGGFIRIGDYIYGGHDHGKGKPTCIEMKTGKIMWQEDQPGGGSAAVLYADGHLYFRYEDNVLALIEANPNRYNLKSTFKLPKRDGMSGPGWAHLVIVDGRLYARHADVLMVYDIKAKHAQAGREE
ncbi:MAG TPA: PQQ-binding-like beta-propeller repeat protein [Sedimentisphaerales bacterium]|nr:PQQ-binding-like beta-propeller repeat protein [Sedimentisphaerales bacterium]